MLSSLRRASALPGHCQQRCRHLRRSGGRRRARPDSCQSDSSGRDRLGSGWQGRRRPDARQGDLSGRDDLRPSGRGRRRSDPRHGQLARGDLLGPRGRLGDEAEACMRSRRTGRSGLSGARSPTQPCCQEHGGCLQDPLPRWFAHADRPPPRVAHDRLSEDHAISGPHRQGGER